MSNRWTLSPSAVLFSVVCFLAVPSLPRCVPEATAATPASTVPSEVATAQPRRPEPGFVENRGQLDSRARFVRRTASASAFLTADRIIASLDSGDVASMRFVGANPSPTLEGERQLDGTTNVISGNVAERWSRGAFVVFHPGQMTTMMPEMGRPEGRVHFAGEHTSAWMGWMEGALESAERVAREVMEAEPG